MHSPATLDDIMALLMAQRAQIDRLTAAVEALSHHGLKSDRDPVAEALIPALARTIGAATFNAADLITHAVRHSADLHAALAAALPGGLSARRLGQLLNRIEGQAFDGYCVRRVATERAGITWQIGPASSASS